jgi:hypothetical protein
MRQKLKTINRSLDELSEEIRRVELALERISTKIHDPEGDLANTVRLSVYQRELQAYLSGVKFAMGEETLSNTSLDHEYLKSTA